MSEFDPTIPTNGTDADANPVRGNFVALAISHAGASAPTAPSQGYRWLDTSDSNNHIYKIYNDGVWRSLFDHCESTPVPSANGPMIPGTESPQLLRPTHPYNGFLYGSEWLLVEMNGLVFQHGHGKVKASSIAVETGPVITGALASAVFVTTSDGYRRINYASANTGPATLEWTWNGVAYHRDFDIR